MLVWSLSDPESYRNIDTSLDTIYSIFDCHNPNPPDIVLCANKCDEMGTDNDLRLCRDKYTQFNVVKTSTIDGTGEFVVCCLFVCLLFVACDFVCLFVCLLLVTLFVACDFVCCL